MIHKAKQQNQTFFCRLGTMKCLVVILPYKHERILIWKNTFTNNWRVNFYLFLFLTVEVLCLLFPFTFSFSIILQVHHVFDITLLLFFVLLTFFISIYFSNSAISQILLYLSHTHTHTNTFLSIFYFISVLQLYFINEVPLIQF